MGLFSKKKKEEFTKYEPDVSKIKSEPIIEEIKEPEVQEQEIEEKIDTDDELEDLKRRQKEIEEKIKEAKKVKERIMVVKELPETPIRDYRDKEGVVHLITIEEAISEILNILKE